MKMIIHKSWSKTDLQHIINTIDLKIVFGHADTKKDLQNKIINYIKDNKNIDIKLEPIYNIKNKDGLIYRLCNGNPKKTLSVKEKADVMAICKKIIWYCKNHYMIESVDYNCVKDIHDDMDYIKQFGQIPSVRRCCKLMNENIECDVKFTPLVPPEIQQKLDAKKERKLIPLRCSFRHAPPGEKILVYFE